MFMNKFFTLICIAVFTFQIGYTQELYVGDNTEFYLGKEMPFTTSSTIVTLGSTGIFSVEAENDWGSLSEYVNGKVIAYGDGTTKLPTGNNGVYAPVFANHTGTIEASYFNIMPTVGTNGTDVDAVSTKEFWKLSGNAVITLPWNSDSDITSLVNDNGGNLSSVSIVGLNGGVWGLASAINTNTVTGDLLNGTVTSDVANEITLGNFTQYTFGIDHQAVLSIDDLFQSNDIRIISNPIENAEKHIQFTVTHSENLQVTLYDFMGKRIRIFKDVTVQSGKGEILKPNLRNGVYFLKFEQEGKQGVKKIIVK